MSTPAELDLMVKVAMRDALLLIAARLRGDTETAAEVTMRYLGDKMSTAAIVGALVDCIATLLSGDDFSDMDVAQYLEGLAR